MADLDRRKIRIGNQYDSNLVFNGDTFLHLWRFGFGILLSHGFLDGE